MAPTLAAVADVTPTEPLDGRRTLEAIRKPGALAEVGCDDRNQSSHFPQGARRSWVLSSTPPQSTQVCTHERRPGTTVCLRCRHAERAENLLRMKRLLLRGSAVGIVIATFIAAGAVGAKAVRANFDDASANRAAKAADSTRRATKSAAPVTEVAVDTTAAANAVATTVAPASSAPVTSTPAASTPAPSPKASPAPAPTAPASRVASASRPAAPISPVLPMGHSDLPDSVVAERGDSDVVVSFDLIMTRTRRAEKFEQFVRATLPAIYGRPVRDILAKIPDGGLSSQGELLTELPKRGMRIPVTGEWMIRLFPETRLGHDGPLVVRYRVSVVPTGE